MNKKRRILLLEPKYRNKYPPIGLMKIATYHRLLGDHVTFFKGDMKDLVLDELFGVNNFINELIFKSTDPKSLTEKSFSKTHQTIFFYSKTENYFLNPRVGKVSENALKEYSYFMLQDGLVVSSKDAGGKEGRYFKLH